MRSRTIALDYLQAFVDAGIVFCAWFLAYFFRFKLELVGNAEDDLFMWYFNFGIPLVVISLLTFKVFKLYSNVRLESSSAEVATQLQANTTAFLVFLLVAFFISEQRLSRIVLIYYYSFSTFGLLVSRTVFRKIISRKLINLIIVGDGDVAKKYYGKIHKLPNIKVLYWVDPPADNSINVETRSSLDFEKIEKMKIDGLVIGYDIQNAKRSSDLVKQLSDYMIPTIILPDVTYAKIGYTMSEFCGQPLIYLNEPKVERIGLFLKRAFDILLTITGAVFISPVLFMIGLAVRVTSKGPIFYKQTRMGVDGKTFEMWKFRSMVTDQKNNEGWTIKDDPRVTKFGKFIRKTNLDELPQLWNVIKGDMSLVGPRPERPQYVDKFRKEVPGYMIRHKFKAGITGWAQINGWRGDTCIKKRIQYDLWYIRNWSFWLDVAIIFMTFYRGRKNAY